jgi:5-methyltetrahydropteroyltriglutamate--homocysteine methyltransferase
MPRVRARELWRVAPEFLAPDCGMKYIPRDTANGKMAAMAAAAPQLRSELG